MIPLRFDPATLPVTDASHVGDARRTAVTLAASLDFDEAARGQVAIVVTEAATNLARHATGGELVFRSLHDRGAVGFELLAIDRGPGMADAAASLVDGHSTGGTPGTGLGAMARLSSPFEIYTAAPGGTVVLARVWPRPPAPPAPDERAWPDVGVVCLPVRGEVACGDAWHAEVAPGGTTRVLVADGLGHGLHAADASRRAVELFRDHPEMGPARMVEALHAGLRGTRGAAVAVVELPGGDGHARFAGVGNVVAAVLPADGGRARNLISHNGTAGVEARRIQEFAVDWRGDSDGRGDLLLMHSDGLATQWRLDAYPGLRWRHPAAIAAVLYRDFRRPRDDVTVLAIGGGLPPTTAAGVTP